MSAPKPGFRFRGNAVELHTSEAIAETAAGAAAFGEDFRNSFFTRAADGALAFAMATDGTSVPSRVLKARRPTAVILADHHPLAIGPDGWNQRRKLLHWCAKVALHASAGDPHHYEMLAAETIRCRRLLLIEVCPQHLSAWLHLIERERPRLERLLIVPPGHEVLTQDAPAGVSVH